MRSIFVLLFFGFLVSCAPASSKKEAGLRKEIGKNEIPSPSKLTFPVSELVERLVSQKTHYGDFQFLEENIRPSEKDTRFVYNIPEVGSSVEVEFYLEDKKPDTYPDWFITIANPKIKPYEIFKPGETKKTCNDSYPWNAYYVSAGLLKGARVSDWSFSDTKGFVEPNDKAITVASKLKDEEFNASLIGCK